MTRRPKPELLKDSLTGVLTGIDTTLLGKSMVDDIGRITSDQVQHSLIDDFLAEQETRRLEWAIEHEEILKPKDKPLFDLVVEMEKQYESIMEDIRSIKEEERRRKVRART